MPEQGVNNKESGEKKAPNVGRQGCKVKNLRRVVKWVTGERKVWGTHKKESCNEIARKVVKVGGKVESHFSVQKRVGQVNGKDGWWFVVKAPEMNLLKQYSSTGTGDGREFRGEMIFRGGTCVNGAQVNASCSLEGEG